MPKTTLGVVGKGYKSLMPGNRCPSCFHGNTYFSCSESAWVCFGCGEVFPSSTIVILPEHLGVRRRLLLPSPGVAAVAVDFSNLRARLGK